MKARQSGFTLVEIAIVLVIIGLLLGGVLKGQELITNARVRNLGNQVSGVQTAFYAFQDRYRALPGDLTAAQAATVGNGALPATTALGNGTIAVADSATAFQNLTVSGFITCSVCTATGGSTTANSPVNAWGGPMQLVTNAAYSVPTGAAVAVARHNVKTGNNVPDTLMAELDRKLDEGAPSAGSLRHSVWNTGAPGCDINSAVGGAWSVGVNANCGGAWFL